MRTSSQAHGSPAKVQTGPFPGILFPSIPYLPSPSRVIGSLSRYELTKITAAQEPPKLSFAGANPNSTYLVVSLDTDAPFPSFGILGPILHWIQSDIKVTSEGVLVSDAPFIANYIGPAPPPMSAPHRYMFFLYEQPSGFDPTAHAPTGGKKFGNSNRIRYDLDAWAESIKLGPLVAFSYFTCN